MKKLLGFLRLARPANIVTAISDILAGVAIAGYATGVFQLSDAVLLVVATIGLYGGGVVFNDFFDADLDRIERPERPIPSGLISSKEAGVLGTLLLMAGVAAAFGVSAFPSGVIALLIAIAALVYDKWGKHHSIFGPLNMGLCRGLNLLLGMSIVPAALSDYQYLALIPIIYIAAITMISRGEVHGGRSNIILFAGLLYLLVILAILYVAATNEQLTYSILFLLSFGLVIYPPLFKAFREPAGKNIGKAVKAGVLALILMNASWASAFGAIYLALFMVLLLPLSLLLARIFAVT